MLNIFKKIRLENLKRVLKETFNRLPLSVLISLSIFVTLIIRIYIQDFGQDIENIIDKSIFALSVTFFFSVGIYLFTETIGVSKAKKWFFQIDSLIFGFLFFYFFEENLFTNFQEETLVYILSTTMGVILFIFIAPFIQKILNKHLIQREFYIYSFHLFIRILMSIIVGVSAMLLGFAALQSVFTLFDLNFIDESKAFMYWATFSLSLFAPIFFLTNLPSVKVNQKDKVEDNKFYSFLVNFVGLPAISIYFLILYSYTVKVLMNFSEWPQGEVAWMVIGFSSFGYLIYFASYIFEEKIKTIEIFRKYFPIAVIPQITMLFYAIFLRINQYNITINRYLVVVLGIWLLFISLYFIFSKKRYLGTLVYSLVITILIISIGPWSVYLYPEGRQQDKMVENLKEANILVKDEIKPLENYSDISDELSGNVYGNIEYLCNFHGCKTLDFIFEKEINEIKKEHEKNWKKGQKEKLEFAQDEERVKNIEEQEYRGISNWELISELSKKIKVKRYFKNSNEREEKFISFYSKDGFNQESIKVSGYDYFLRIFSDVDSEFCNEIKADNRYKTIINNITEELIVYYEDEEIEIFSLKEVFKEILKEKDNGIEEFVNNYQIESEKMTFVLNGKKLEVKINFDNVSILNPDYKSDEDEDRSEFPVKTLSYTSGYILMKIK